jgi:hypothetical protein
LSLHDIHGDIHGEWNYAINAQSALS